MDNLDLPHVLKMLAFPTTLRVMYAVKALGRASLDDLVAHLAQEGAELSQRQVNNALYKLVELGAVRRVPVSPQGRRADWQYDDQQCAAFMRRMETIFGPPSR